MNSILINLRRVHGGTIPFAYNYHLAISLYSKLMGYQADVRKLHTSSQVSMHTFSNIISKRVIVKNDGLDIESGSIIFRTLDPRLETYLRLGLAEDPHLRILDTLYNVTSIHNTEEIRIDSSTLRFKSMSPVLVRDYEKEGHFISEGKDLEANLTKATQWLLNNKFLLNNPKFVINIDKKLPKTVRVSSNSGEGFLTRAFNVTGFIEADAEALRIIYYRGLGAKTALGLGCIEVIK
jgi:CRISPR-associated endoribonuclease Cas6